MGFLGFGRKKNNSQKSSQRRPDDFPSPEEIEAAIDVLDAQYGYVYNVLLEQDLTSPSGFPLKVSRKIVEGSPTEVICVSLLHNNTYDLFFYTDGSEGRDSILRKARMLTGVGWRKKIHVYACCPYAELRGNTSICELHGENPLIPR